MRTWLLTATLIAVGCGHTHAGDLKSSWGDCAAGHPPALVIARCTELVGSKDPHIREHAYNTRGLALLGQAQYGPAIDDFTQVVRLNPKIAGYFDNRQNAYKAAGRFAEALGDADEAVRLAPTYAFVFHARANLLTAMGQFGRARADYDKALAMAPDDAGLYVDRGKSVLQAGDPDAAAVDFTHAIALNASSATAYRERGLIYKSAGLTDKARDDLQAAQRLAPNDTAVHDALRDLNPAAAPSSPEQKVP